MLYAYAHTLVREHPPTRLQFHLAPAAAQVLYLTACFLLPLRWKWSWYIGLHREFVEPTFGLLTVVSLAAYGWGIQGGRARYRARLSDERSDADRYGARGLGHLLTAVIVAFSLQAGLWLWSATAGGIDYFQELGLYIGIATLGVFLGVTGCRIACLPLPPADLVGTLAQPERPGPNWSAIVAEIAERTRRDGWWRDPLAHLARLLGTNSTRLSRAINLGLGINLSYFVNNLRAEDVAERLRSDQDRHGVRFQGQLQPSLQGALRPDALDLPPTSLRTRISGQRPNSEARRVDGPVPIPR